MIDQNQLIQYGHPSGARDFRALSHDKLYLDRFNNIQQYSDTNVINSNPISNWMQWMI